MRSWADDFNTYEEACRYYGVDTPAQLEAEDRAIRDEYMESMEKAFGPWVWAPHPTYLEPWEDDCPF